MKFEDLNNNIFDAKNNNDLITTNLPTTSTKFLEVDLGLTSADYITNDCFFAIENKHAVYDGLIEIDGKFGRNEDNCFFAIKIINSDTDLTAILRMIEDYSNVLIRTNQRYVDNNEYKKPKAIIRKVFVKEGDDYKIRYYMLLLMNDGTIMKLNQIRNPRMTFTSTYAFEENLN